MAKKAAKKPAKKPASKADRFSEAAKTVAKAVAKSKAEKSPSALDAAAKVLSDAKAPMTTKELIEAMAAKYLWKSPEGKTPERTLYSAVSVSPWTRYPPEQTVAWCKGSIFSNTPRSLFWDNA